MIKCSFPESFRAIFQDFKNFKVFDVCLGLILSQNSENINRKSGKNVNSNAFNCLLKYQSEIKIFWSYFLKCNLLMPLRLKASRSPYKSTSRQEEFDIVSKVYKSWYFSTWAGGKMHTVQWLTCFSKKCHHYRVPLTDWRPFPFFLSLIFARKYPSCGYFLGVPIHTNA